MHAQGSIGLAVSFDDAGEVYHSFAWRRTQHACEFHNLWGCQHKSRRDEQIN